MKVTGLVLSLVSFFGGSMAMAEGLGFDLKYGMRYNRTYRTVNKKDVLEVNNSSVYTFGVNHQVMDLPLAIGVDTSLTQDFKKDLEEKLYVESSYGVEITPKVKAWLPESIHGLSYLRPYIEVGAVAYGFSVREVKESKNSKDFTRKKYSCPGFVTGTGFDVRLTDMVALNVGYTYLYNPSISLSDISVADKNGKIQKIDVAEAKKEVKDAKIHAFSHQLGFGINISI